MKTALLIDTSFSATPLVSALQAQGIEVWVVGAKANDTLAKNNSRWMPVDYSSPGALRELLEERRPDYLIPGCNDLSYEICCEVNDAIGRPYDGLDDTQTLYKLHRKNRFRDFCSESAIKAPRHFLNPESVTEADLPVVVKPVDAFSGVGITVVRSMDSQQLSVASASAAEASKRGEYLVEQFVEGQLYSLSAFIEQGSIGVAFLVREYGFENPYVVDTSYLIINDELLARATCEAKKIIAGLELCFGLLHLQFIERDGEVFVIEVARRCPGDLYSRLIALSTGYDYGAAYVAPFIGNQVNAQSSCETAKILRHTVTGRQHGVFSRYTLTRGADLAEFHSLASSGDMLSPSPKGRIGVAFFRCAGDSEIHRLRVCAEQRRLAQVEYF